MTVNKEMIAPCGIYCEPCPLYRAQFDEALRQSLSERLQRPPEEVPCRGCRPTAGSPTPLHGEVCCTFACAENKGHETCGECADFPCNLLHPAADRAAILPHNCKVFSLLVLRRDGVERWAEQYPQIGQRYYQGRMVIGSGPMLPDDEK